MLNRWNIERNSFRYMKIKLIGKHSLSCSYFGTLIFTRPLVINSRIIFIKLNHTTYFFATEIWYVFKVCNRSCISVFMNWNFLVKNVCRTEYFHLCTKSFFRYEFNCVIPFLNIENLSNTTNYQNNGPSLYAK